MHNNHSFRPSTKLQLQLDTVNPGELQPKMDFTKPHSLEKNAFVLLNIGSAASAPCARMRASAFMTKNDPLDGFAQQAAPPFTPSAALR
jgi:hypothetical protein